MHNKKADFARLRYCRWLATSVQKQTNANDNFANDNAEFARVAVAA